MATEDGKEQPTDFEKTVSGLAPDQFERVSGIVLSEWEKRNEQATFQKMPGMTSREYREAVQKKFGYDPGV